MRLCKQYKLKVEYFIDKNADVIQQIDDVNVYLPEKLETEVNDVITVVVANYAVASSILKDSLALNLPRNVQVFPGTEFVSLLQCADCLFSVHGNRETLNSKCLFCINVKTGCSLVLKEDRSNAPFEKPAFEFMGCYLGQKCTLKCKHCVEAVPYIQKPISISVDQVIKDIKKIADACSRIVSFDFVGGEPFLFKGLADVLKNVLNISTIKRFVIVSNGTVVPSLELIDVLRHPKVFVTISGYGATLSDNIKERIALTIKCLKDNGIKYVINSTGFTWADMNTYEKRNASEKELKKYYTECFLQPCHKVFNGAFYGCPHQYSGIQLGKIQKHPYEYIDIHSMPTEELSDRLVKFQNLDFIEACRYCNMPYDAELVPAAIQLE